MESGAQRAPSHALTWKMGKVWGPMDVLPGEEAAGGRGQSAPHPMTYLEVAFFVVHLSPRGLFLPRMGAPPSWCTEDILMSAERPTLAFGLPGLAWFSAPGCCVCALVCSVPANLCT